MAFRAFGAFVCALLAASASAQQPPVAKKVPILRNMFGDVCEDNYAWLRDKTDPDTIAYVQAENDYLTSMTQSLTGLKQELYNEISERESARLTGPDVTINGYIYSRRAIEGPFNLWLRRPVNTPPDQAIIILDESELAKSQPGYFKVGSVAISPSSQYLAIAVDYVGNMNHVLQIKDMTTGLFLPENITGVYGSIEWCANSEYIFYDIVDNVSGQPLWIKLHKINTDISNDINIFNTTDNLMYYVSIEKSNDGLYFFLYKNGLLSTEAYYLSTSTPLGQFTVVLPLRYGVIYHVEHRSGLFFFLTNDKSINFFVAAVNVPVDNSPVNATALKTIMLENLYYKVFMRIYKEYICVYELRDASPRVTVFHIDSALNPPENGQYPIPPMFVTLPAGWLHVMDWQKENAVFRYSTFYDPYVIVFVSSFLIPDTLYAYHFENGSVTVVDEMQVPNYSRSGYIEERLEVPSATDNQWIPVTLAFKQISSGSLPVNQPLLLEGFGAFGDTTGPRFSAARISLLQRGVVFGIAHVRGGGLLGPEWHDQGRLLLKNNTFTDFDTCVSYLIRLGCTTSDKLGVYGRLAGGLISGVIMTRYAKQVRLVLADVPFVDAVNTMLDETIPWTVYEYDEWGNPQNETVYYYMSSYDTYTQLKPQQYPPRIFFTAAWENSVVRFHEAAKVMAKLRSVATNDPSQSLFFLNTIELSGREGATDVGFLDNIATQYAFIIDSIVIPDEPCSGFSCYPSNTTLAVIIGSATFVVLFLIAFGYVTYRVLRTRKRSQYSQIKDGDGSLSDKKNPTVQKTPDDWLSDGSSDGDYD